MHFLIIAVTDFYLKLQSRQEVWLERLIRLTIYGGVLVIPLFFIPGNNVFAEYGKVVILLGLISLALIFWLLKIFLAKRINWQYKFLDLPIVLFVIVYFLASLFSLDRYQSLIGSNLQIGQSFLAILGLFVFYLLVSRFIVELDQIQIALYCLIASIYLILVGTILNLLPLNLALPNYLIPVNTFNFSLVLGLICCSTLYLIAGQSKIKMLSFILGLILLVFLIILDKEYFLLILALAIFTAIFLFSLKSQYFSNKLVITLTAVLFLVIIAIVFPLSNFINLISPDQLTLPTQYATQITKATLNDNLLLGVGPQNFVYSFYKYKPVFFNSTAWWQFGFTQNSNIILEILNNTGLLGLIMLVSIWVFYLYHLIRQTRQLVINEAKQYKKYILIVGLLVSMCAFIILAVISNYDFVALFWLFLFFALGSAACGPTLPNIKTNKAIINFAACLGLILVLIFIVYSSRLVGAEVTVRKIQSQNYSNVEQVDASLAQLKNVYSAKKEQPDYYLQLANLLIIKQRLLPEIDTDIKDEVLATFDMIWLKAGSRLSVYLTLNQLVADWQQAGVFALDWKEKINKKILELDPNNPELYIDRALINYDRYFLAKGAEQVSVSEQESLIKKIKSDLEMSLNLKENYVLGFYNLGLLFIELDDQTNALANITKAYELNSQDKTIVLTLKKLYLNQDKVQEAEDLLNKYLESIPADNEVRLQLALLYKDTERLAEAKAEVNKILTLEPDNQNAQALLEQIK